MSDMNEKSSKKILCKILLIMSAAICVCAFLAAQYLGGQQKTIDKYYTSLVREDFSSFEELFAGGVLADGSTDRLAEENNRIVSGLASEENDTVHVRINFKGRDMTSLTEGKYYFTVTYFDGSAHDITTGTKCFELSYHGMKWRLGNESPEEVLSSI